MVAGSRQQVWCWRGDSYIVILRLQTAKGRDWAWHGLLKLKNLCPVTGLVQTMPHLLTILKYFLVSKHIIFYRAILIQTTSYGQNSLAVDEKIVTPVVRKEGTRCEFQ